MRMRGHVAAVAVSLCLSPCASAETMRALLTRASFVDRDRASALAHVDGALAEARATLKTAPADGEAMLMEALALGYRAKLTGSRSEALGARKGFERVVAQQPGNAEALLALGAWHVSAVKRLGSMLGRAALGARSGTGLAAMDRAVALGGNRALFPGLAALMRLQIDPDDARAHTLAEAAARAPAPTINDRYLQRAAREMLAALQRRDDVRKLAERLLPLGMLPPK